MFRKNLNSVPLYETIIFKIMRITKSIRECVECLPDKPENIKTIWHKINLLSNLSFHAFPITRWSSLNSNRDMPKIQNEDIMLRNNRPKDFFMILPVAVVLILFTENVLAHSWMAPKDAAERQNPTPLNDVSVSRGKEIYLENCAYCHGDTIKGLSSSTTGLQKDTPDLIQRLKTHTDGDFHWKIQNGRDEMPSFKEDLSEKEIWDVINFIRSMGNS